MYKKRSLPTVCKEGFFIAKRKAESLLNDSCSRGISVKFHILYPKTKMAGAIQWFYAKSHSVSLRKRSMCVLS